MAELPWLTIIGMGEDGPEGLTPASLDALENAEVVMAPARHLSLLPVKPKRAIEWPAPFAEGIEVLRDLEGQHVVVLASGDPFWFGAGSVLAREFGNEAWVARPGPSCFSLAANHLGWSLEKTLCLGLHAAPLTRLRPHLASGQQMIVTLRDGEAPAGLAAYLSDQGFGESTLHVMEALGGPREKCRSFLASDLSDDLSFTHPLCVAMYVQGDGSVLSLTAGQSDDWFENDGQITKRPIRALTLSALAPRPEEHLWDIGGGSGSIAIEWLLSDPSVQATSIEADPDRAERIARNAARLGVDRLSVVTGTAPEAMDGLPRPHSVFVGGGLTAELLACLTRLGAGTRLVANAVTLEAEALLADAHSTLGGELMRIEIAQAKPLGRKHGWRSAYPIVQWSVKL